MTRPLASDTAASRWCSELADTLADAARRLGRLVDDLAADWPDEAGRIWTERATQLRGELGRHVEDAVELGNRLGQADADHAAGPQRPDSGAAPSAATGYGGRTGIRLGATGGVRADDDRGLRIAELPPPG